MKKKLATIGALTAIVASIAVPASLASASSSVQGSVTAQSVTIQATQKYVRYSDANNKYGDAKYVPKTYTYADGVWYGVLNLASTTNSNGLYYGNYEGYVTKME
ncbi:hypothetical protein CXK86_10440 [Paenibacillus sp. BGI2013]|uniref:hypothetical protein n=1 Tax=Paenibacillus TaxID=44249 RepID=UPI00096DAFF1|nr:MULTISPECIES: hypothetical protein [Paenibacillus]OMF46244.1 hypothetical protein BK136_06305 [Paenibacillus amylolyticus]PKQ91707.1 hypothetical protein CXK86_10440 [Paenibacillus sp. BGI2013]